MPDAILSSVMTRRQLPNGWRYPLVGGTRAHHFAGTNSEPQKLPENAAHPTCRLHAVLGALIERKT